MEKIDKIRLSRGRVDSNVQTFRSIYYIKDHLGSTRLVIDNTGAEINAFDYYPFGEIKSCLLGQTDTTRYKFTGKERDLLSNYDYFGARYYDSELGRWLSVDPLAGKYEGWSSYNYCKNNPLVILDPNGKDIRYFIDEKIKPSEWKYE